MSLFDFLVYLVIAGFCGAVARAVVGGSTGGFLLSVMVGFLGAFLGTWIAKMARLPAFFVVTINEHPFPILWSVIGGMILVALAHALTRPRYTHYIDRHAP